MKGELIKEINDWLKKADDDLLAANQLNSQQLILTSIICFHCQQAIEKYLKAYLLSHNFDVSKTHNIELLSKKASDFNNEFNKFDFGNLTDFAVQFRYPGEDILPDKEEIKYYIDLCENLQKFDLTLLLNN